ncbi:MAG: hypothetical protein Tsb009_35080 [Planctomycetaceae bacterium]
MRLRATLPLICLTVCFAPTNVIAAGKPAKLSTIRVTSSLDKTAQPSMFWAPDSAKSKATPLLVFLHSWSGDYRQNNSKWFLAARKQGWMFLHPNFRGRNDHPEACGSKKARQDILDAMDWVFENYKVNSSRVYLAGTSGGGHMTMLMAAYFPNRFSAASAWVGISDLAEWYRFHTRTGKPGRYARMIIASLNGPPGKSEKIDKDYRSRSPIFHLHRVGKLPLDLNAGVRDGKTGSVPIMHTLNAFNVIARAGKHRTISQQEIDQLWKTGKLTKPRPEDIANDKSYGRKILLRRHAGPARVTIFDGGHEGLVNPSITWLAKQRRKVSR